MFTFYYQWRTYKYFNIKTAFLSTILVLLYSNQCGLRLKLGLFGKESS